MTDHVLIVEDHAPTAQLLATVVEEVDPAISAHVVRDGQECLAVLRGEVESVPPPDLMLLDLHLPVVDGLSVLEMKREDPTVRDVPTVVVSGTDDQDAIVESYRKGANAFIGKPDDLDEYHALVDNVIEFWLSGEESPAMSA